VGPDQDEPRAVLGLRQRGEGGVRLQGQEYGASSSLFVVLPALLDLTSSFERVQTVFNPGTVVSANFYKYADIVVSFETYAKEWKGCVLLSLFLSLSFSLSLSTC